MKNLLPIPKDMERIWNPFNTPKQNDSYYLKFYCTFKPTIFIKYIWHCNKPTSQSPYARAQRTQKVE